MGYPEVKYNDEAVIEHYPFLAEPLTADKVNIDGATRLLSAIIADAKESYISQARNLKKFGFSVPTSMKEYRESNINKRVSNRLKEIDEDINDIDAEKWNEFIKIRTNRAKEIVDVFI